MNHAYAARVNFAVRSPVARKKKSSVTEFGLHLHGVEVHCEPGAKSPSSVGSHTIPAVNNLSGLFPDILLTPDISVTGLFGKQREDFCFGALGVFLVMEPVL